MASRGPAGASSAPRVLAAGAPWARPVDGLEPVHLGAPRRAAHGRPPLLLAERSVSGDHLQPEREARRLVTDLIADAVPGNAANAVWRLRGLGPAALPALTDALKTHDAQQRMFVVSLLFELGAPASDDLMRAALLNLESDHFSSAQLRDDTDSTRLMIGSGERAWPVALAGLLARDPQRRFLCAVVLAHTRCPRRVELTVTVLAGHLRDNHWRGDAAIASRALFALGDLALPGLRRLRGMPGLQARRLVALVISELESPSLTRAEAYERARRVAPGADGRPLTVWRFRRDGFYGLDG